MYLRNASGRGLFGVGRSGRLIALAMTLLVAFAGRSDGEEIEYGLAAEYPGDAGIEKDPDVVLFEDYELDGMDELARRGWRWSPGAEKKIYSLSTDPNVPFAGQRCLVKKAVKGQNGAIMPRDLDPAENGAVYHRVYLKYPRRGPAVRVMGICGVKDGWPTWKAIGSAPIHMYRKRSPRGTLRKGSSTLSSLLLAVPPR